MKQYGVIGNPLHHSYSKAYFNEKFQEQAIDARYDNYLLPTIKDVMKVLNDTPNLCGLNVTIPYKEQVMEYLDEIDDEAKEIGAEFIIQGTLAADKIESGATGGDSIKSHHNVGLNMGEFIIISVDFIPIFF